MRYIYIKTSHDKALKQEVIYEKPQQLNQVWPQWLTNALAFLKYHNYLNQQLSIQFHGPRVIFLLKILSFVVDTAFFAFFFVKMKRYANRIFKVLVVHLKYIFGHFNQMYLSLLHVAKI